VSGVKRTVVVVVTQQQDAAVRHIEGKQAAVIDIVQVAAVPANVTGSDEKALAASLLLGFGADSGKSGGNSPAPMELLREATQWSPLECLGAGAEARQHMSASTEGYPTGTGHSLRHRLAQGRGEDVTRWPEVVGRGCPFAEEDSTLAAYCY
jgi:hypothetical protein